MTKQELQIMVSKNVRYIRKSLNQNITEFANNIGVKRANLAALEEGRTMGIETVLKVSEYTKLTLDKLFKVDIENEPDIVFTEGE